ncbi:MAG: hypothetical protein ABFC67_14570 [Mizugakiibacter sp.]|uniref:hypothetical protein n=1 Tax=Mizugakiibacter sp. TaxID=1972610 RepID=UPI00320EF4EF
MRFFKDISNNISAYPADGSQDHFISTDLVEISESEAMSIAATSNVAVPSVVSMRQARRALYDAGMLSNVEAAIAGMSGVDGDKARIDWATATTVERGNALVASLAAALGLTGAQLDALFTQAAAL